MANHTSIPTDPPFIWVAALQAISRRDGQLGMWSIYDRPKDHPEHYVMRQFLCDAKGARPTHNAAKSTSLHVLRATLHSAGLVCLQRSDDDDPSIIETWL